MKVEQFREIKGRFLLNELGDPHLLINKFKWHTVEYNISRFEEKLKILLFKRYLYFNDEKNTSSGRYCRVCTHTANSLIFLYP